MRWAPRSSSATPTIFSCGRAWRSSVNFGGLHKFMNWHKPILTDSGGFQVFQPGQAALDHGGGGRVPLPPRRLEVLPRAEGSDGNPACARVRHHDGLRRMPALALRGGEGERRGAAHHPLGARVARSSSASHRDGTEPADARAGALRHRAGRQPRPPARRLRRARWWRWISTATPSAA